LVFDLFSFLNLYIAIIFERNSFNKVLKIPRNEILGWCQRSINHHSNVLVSKISSNQRDDLPTEVDFVR